MLSKFLTPDFGLTRNGPKMSDCGLHLDLLGEERLQDGEKHVEESSSLADVDFPEPQREPLLKARYG